MTQGTSPKPVFLIGLDSCEQELLRRWADEGVLPTLRRLLTTGLSMRIESTVGLYGGAAWSSFATGLNPAGHGHFCRRQARKGAYLDGTHAPADVAGEQFWSVLDAAGRRVAVLDIPHAKASPAMRGIEILDWITHDPHYPNASVQPASLGNELHRHAPRPPIDDCQALTGIDAQLASFVARQQARIAAKVAATELCLARGPWDFFATVFGEGHCSGHRCWHVHDSAHAIHDPDVRARHGDPVRDVYVALDTALARILARLPPDATVLVLASHGMGPVHAAENAVLDDVLMRLDHGRQPPRGAMFRSLKRCWYALPAHLREWTPLARMQGRAQPHLRRAMLVPSRMSRRFFAIPNDRYAGAVRINLAGRETHGVVAPEAYAATCDEVREALCELVDLDTGEPVVTGWLEPQRALAGPHREALPDLVVEWSRTRAIRAIGSPRLGRWRLPPITDRTGDHRNAGLLVAVGPGLASRRLDTPVAIEDVAPTIAALAGVSLPPGDGRPIEAVVTPALSESVSA